MKPVALVFIPALDMSPPSGQNLCSQVAGTPNSRIEPLATVIHLLLS
jgi:hypothetical protein